MYQTFFKRTLDITLSLLGLFFLSLPMLILGILIKLDDPGPALFQQKRVGKNKKLFLLYKFRSMKAGTPETPTHLLKNPDQHITRIGKMIRRTSMDELPQLFNILKGDMSIVGPRPALWNQKDLILERDKYGANQLRPGLTGWAQINGRDELPTEVKAKLDGEYKEKMSFLFDLKCFFRTIGPVIKSDGVVEGSILEEKEVSSL